MKKDTDEYLLTVLEKGDTFYHYTSAECLQGILSGEFWLTESDYSALVDHSFRLG